MDATAWVALAGIGGTLLAPVLAERVRRKSTRLDRLTTERIAAYAELLQATARLADNAMTWSAIPLADLQETDDAELDRIISRVRVVASTKVYGHLGEISRRAHRFNLMLHEAKVRHQQVHDQGHVDTGQTIRQRWDLGGVAAEIVEAHKQIEAAVREELGG